MVPLNILYFGSDDFAAKILNRLLTSNVQTFKNIDVVIPFNGSRVMRLLALSNNLKYYIAPEKTLNGWRVLLVLNFLDPW